MTELRRLSTFALWLFVVVMGCGDSAASTDAIAPTMLGTAPVATAGAAAPVASAGTAGATSPVAKPTSPEPVTTAAAGSSAGAAGAAEPSSAADSGDGTAGAGPDVPAIPTAGAGGSAAAGAGGGSAGAAGAEAPEEHEDLGMGDGSDVITIGDSWMNYTLNGGGIETGLLAASGQPYRTYALQGTMLLDEVIPNQYAAAKRENPDIKTVVMAAGGNDLLLTGMSSGGCNEGCEMTIDEVTERLSELWAEMAADGVQDVVFIEYSRGGSNAEGVTYANEVVPPACAAAPVRCHFIDSDLFIMMQLLDGVHPTADGCAKLGKAAYDLMVEKGMRR